MVHVMEVWYMTITRQCKIITRPTKMQIAKHYEISYITGCLCSQLRHWCRGEVESQGSQQAKGLIRIFNFNFLYAKLFFYITILKQLSVKSLNSNMKILWGISIFEKESIHVSDSDINQQVMLGFISKPQGTTVNATAVISLQT